MDCQTAIITNLSIAQALEAIAVDNIQNIRDFFVISFRSQKELL